MQAALLPLALQAGSAALGAVGTMQAAKADKAQAERNAFIGRTRALQTDTSARDGLNDELATMRATLGANGQPGGAFEIMRALRETRGRERRIEVGNRMQEASDWRMKGKNALSQGRWKAASQLASAGPSLFDIYQLRGRNG